MKRTPLVLLVLATLGAPSASTAADYMIAFNNGGAFLPEVHWTTGFRRDTSFALAPQNGSGTLTGGAWAGPGYVAVSARVDCVWDGIFSGSFYGKTRASIATNDFVISGPAGPSTVPGTIQLRARFSLQKARGTGSNAHNAAFHLNASTLYSGALGTVTFGNSTLSASGCFAGVSSPNVDMIIPLTGNYPVNTPFSITIYTEGAPSAYGNVNDSPAMAATEGGGAPGDPNGRGIRLESTAMTLPAGYTLNSASWGVVNNTYSVPVAVDAAEPPREVGLTLAGANPTSRDARLALRLPRESHVRVVVHDLAGRALRTLHEGWTAAGEHALVWDGRDQSGSATAAGLYFVRADVGGVRITRSLVRVR